MRDQHGIGAGSDAAGSKPERLCGIDGISTAQTYSKNATIPGAAVSVVRTGGACRLDINLRKRGRWVIQMLSKDTLKLRNTLAGLHRRF